MEEPVGRAQAEVYRANLAVLEARFTAVNLLDRVQARLVEEQVARARSQLARAEERQRALLLRAGREGRFVVPRPEHLPGRFLRQGEVVGYVLAETDPTIRAVIPQAEIDLVRTRTRAVAVRGTQAIHEVLPAQIRRETPQALTQAPAPALAAEGGGPILTAPSSEAGGGSRPIEQFFEIELVPTGGLPGDFVGGRVFMRFDHGAEPVGWRLWRATRQLFLTVLDV